MFKSKNVLIQYNTMVKLYGNGMEFSYLKMTGVWPGTLK